MGDIPLQYPTMACLHVSCTTNKHCVCIAYNVHRPLQTKDWINTIQNWSSLFFQSVSKGRMREMWDTNGPIDSEFHTPFHSILCISEISSIGCKRSDRKESRRPR